MIIETTTPVDSFDDAARKLDRVSEEPGFIFGYIKVVNHTNKRGEFVLSKDYVVTIFDVQDKSLPPNDPSGVIHHREVRAYTKGK